MTLQRGCVSPVGNEHTVCQTFSCGFNSGHFGGSGTMVILGGTTRSTVEETSEHSSYKV